MYSFYPHEKYAFIAVENLSPSYDMYDMYGMLSYGRFEEFLNSVSLQQPRSSTRLLLLLLTASCRPSWTLSRASRLHTTE